MRDFLKQKGIDIIDMPLKGGKWSYQCTWMDLYSRQIAGWQLANNMQERSIRELLERALLKRKVKAGIIIQTESKSKGLRKHSNSFPKTSALMISY